MVVEALKAGKNVFVEKPFAIKRGIRRDNKRYRETKSKCYCRF